MIQIHEDMISLLENKGFSVYHLPPSKIRPNGLNTWNNKQGDEIIESHTIVSVIYYDSLTNPWGYSVASYTEGKEKIVAGYFCLSDKEEPRYLWILPDFSIVVLSKEEMIQRLNLLVFL